MRADCIKKRRAPVATERGQRLQVGRIEGFMGFELKDVGRHDWTRTNDPHHVKVVL